MRDDVSTPYEVLLADEAFYALASLPSDRLLEHVERDLALLETTPYLGEKYDPAYEAARPPFPCRILFCEHLGIYYSVDDVTRHVIVFAIEDQRRNPTKRFNY